MDILVRSGLKWEGEKNKKKGGEVEKNVNELTMWS